MQVDADKRKQMTATMKQLKLTQNQLSKTLRSLKEEQQALQTALRKFDSMSKSTNFRISQMQSHGSGSLAYSTLQAGLKYFMLEGVGYLSFVELGDNRNSVLVLSDPICPRDRECEFIDAFLKDRNDPVFLHISYPTAKILGELGFCVNQLGVETIIEIQDFELTGNKKQQLRAARNRAIKDDIKVREVFQSDDAMMTALKRISDGWLSQKVASDSQMKLVVRPMVYIDEIDVRRFVAIKDNKIIGFVVFDPMYKNKQVIGYIANQLRSNYEKGFSVVDYIILEAMQVFKDEGKTEISLGLSPMYKVDDGHEFKHSKLLKAHFNYAFEKANYLYNFKNLARHKNLYRPDMKGAREDKVYCAMKTRFFLSRMLSVYKALGLNPIQKTCEHIKDVITEKFRSCFCHTRKDVHEHESDDCCSQKK